MGTVAEPILIVAPDGASLQTLHRLLESSNTLLLTAASSDSAFALARKYRPKVAVVDLAFDSQVGLTLCNVLKQHSELPFTAVLLIGAPALQETAEYRRLLRRPGVFAVSTYAAEGELAGRVQSMINLARGIRQSPVAIDPSDPVPPKFNHLVGRSPAMLRVYDLLNNAAPTDCSVLILGETGTGKELAARTLHELSERRRGPYVAVNPAAFNENMVESEIFGHEQGAFTGAIKRRFGCLERANRGTLYLDEVDSVPLAVQIKLLRALQEHRFERVGGEDSVPADFRLVASATGLGQLRSAIEKNAFRSDFFYRLHGVIIPLPPLRERGEDIELLVQHFLERLALKYARPLRLGPHALEPLTRYSWPGNVRELERAVESAVVLSPSDLIESIPLFGGSSPAETFSALASDTSPPYIDYPSRPQESLNYRKFMEQQRVSELEFFRELLRRSGNRGEAVRRSGLSRATFYRRLRDLGLVRRGLGENGSSSDD
ncbi:MAG TPA: sigma-54 dependent transcriptional regulator [Candidatus Binataceae bacterium]|nr:sigma-54 dependent transcriptional regulator [Candidatus Binataceae bacterium]